MSRKPTERGGRAPSQRQLRVGEALRHAVVRVLERGHFRDPDLAGVSVTVTEVRVSPDLKNATAFVTPLAGRDMERVVAALNRAAGYVRHELGREVVLRYLPALGFEPDRSFDHSARIEELLNRPDVARDLRGGPGEDGRGA